MLTGPVYLPGVSSEVLSGPITNVGAYAQHLTGPVSLAWSVLGQQLSGAVLLIGETPSPMSPTLSGPFRCRHESRQLSFSGPVTVAR